MDSYYKILEISPNATPEDIKERFKFLAQAYHPDKFGSATYKQIAQEHFQLINVAYQVLSNPSKRARYDQLQGHNKKPDATGPISPPNLHSNVTKFKQDKNSAQTVKTTQPIPIKPLGQNNDHLVIDQLEQEIISREQEIDNLTALLPKISQAHSGLITFFLIIGVLSLALSERGIQFTYIGLAGIATGLGLVFRRFQIYQMKFLPTLEEIKQRKMQLQRLEYARKSVKDNLF